MLRKIIPTIIIALIFVNLFAPFSVGIDSNDTPSITKSVAEAADQGIKFNVVRSGNSITLTFIIDRVKTDHHNLVFVGVDGPGTTIQKDKINVPLAGSVNRLEYLVKSGAADNLRPQDVFSVPSNSFSIPGIVDVSNNAGNGSTVKDISCQDPSHSNDGCIEKTVTITVPNLDKNKDYYFSYWGFNGNQVDGIQQEVDHKISTDSTQTFSSQNLQAAVTATYQAMNDACKDDPNRTTDACQKATKDYDAALQASKTANGNSPIDALPACGIFGESSIMGCVVKISYYLGFVPTSYLFALSGMFLDTTFGYTVKDTSYRSPFILEGWGLVRDFVNIFFIFILLYIALATVLDIKIGGHNPKGMIINVIIIGLMMNFSLFAAQLIVDTSNVLARVFYNSNVIKISIKGNNGLEYGGIGLYDTNDPNGNLQLSAAIVGKVNPVILITQAQNSNIDSGSIGTGTWFLVVLLSMGINVVGIIVFTSVGLIFVSRVIGLWIYMILAPFAFFSYTVPSMQSFETVGWKKWWPQVLSLSFLAPVFIFFMYLIIKFLSLTDIVNVRGGAKGVAFVIGVIVPFIFIMVLLMRARDIAKKMSGTLGQSITGGISKVGGFALGAATGGAAVLGRSTIGRAANKISNSKSLNNLASGLNASGTARTSGISGWALRKAATFGKQASTRTAKGSFDLRQTGAGNEFSKQTGLNLNNGTGALGLDTKKTIGGWKGAQERKLERDRQFSETLGYDHDAAHKIEDSIAEREGAIVAAKREKVKFDNDLRAHKATMPAKLAPGASDKEKAAYNSAMTTYNDKLREITGELNKRNTEIEELENGNGLKKGEGKITGLAEMKKNLEREKESRKNEFYLYKRRQSGHLYAHVERDDNDNIKKFGHSEAKFGKGAAQIGKEALVGALKGATIGSVVPGVGTILGGAIGGIRELVINYSGTTNRKTGDAHNSKEKYEDSYHAPTHAPAAPHAEEHHDAPGDEGHGH